MQSGFAASRCRVCRGGPAAAGLDGCCSENCYGVRGLAWLDVREPTVWDGGRALQLVLRDGSGTRFSVPLPRELHEQLRSLQGDRPLRLGLILIADRGESPDDHNATELASLRSASPEVAYA